ncbi:MAG: cytidine deaminase [Candidatus Puniceispirillaceae bacterium]
MADADKDKLAQAAIEAMAAAYAPYSQFQVGAAIEDDRGQIHTGVNVENAAYPVGSCAEAGAIAAMVRAGGKKIMRIAVAGRGAALCTPCGGCRQRIREFASATTEILVCDAHGVRQVFTLDTLLPHSFGPDNLGER